MLKIAHTTFMDEKKQIDKTTEQLSKAEREILQEHTSKIAVQLNHYLDLKKQKLYLKKKLKHSQIDEVKQELMRAGKNAGNDIEPNQW